MDWTVVATFDNSAAAELAKDLLQREGLAAMLASERVSASPMFDAGAITVMVRETDVTRARAILDASTNLPATDDEIETALATRPDIAANLADPRTAEPIVDNPTDLQVKRLLIVTVFGLLCLSANAVSDLGNIVVFSLPVVRLLALPFHIYALYLAWSLRKAMPPVRHGDRWKIALSLALNVVIWSVVVIPVANMVNLYRSPLTDWRNQRFGALSGTILTIDFPGEHAYDLRAGKTPLGPVDVRIFGLTYKGEELTVSLETLDKTDTPPNPLAAAIQIVNHDCEAIKVESQKDIVRDGRPGVEVEGVYTHRLTQKPRFLREQVFVIDHHIVVLRADVPIENRGSSVVERFFRSAKFR